MRHLNVSYEDALMMPTYDRRLFLEMLKDEKNQEREHYEEMKNSNKGGRGKKLTGDAVKQFARDNQ
jgi:hypothetical protein